MSNQEEKKSVEESLPFWGQASTNGRSRSALRGKRSVTIRSTSRSRQISRTRDGETESSTIAVTTTIHAEEIDGVATGSFISVAEKIIRDHPRENVISRTEYQLDPARARNLLNSA